MDFNRLTEGTPDVDPTDPIALYGTLDRQKTHVDLRNAQREVLLKWQLRRKEHDIVLKLATGSGKTTAGLVMLLSHMRETGKPVLYLCPTNQLAQQVTDEGKRCGIPCIAVGGGQAIPPEIQAGEAIMVTSVHNLFNAKGISTKNAQFEPHAIVVDDAHAAIEIVREQFRIYEKSSSRVYKKLYGIFADALREQSPGLVASVEAEDPDAIVEVPYWAWRDQIDVVSRVLAEETVAAEAEYAAMIAEKDFKAAKKASKLPLVWALIRDYVQGVRCIFSGTAVEIVPEVLPVSAVRIYSRAKHRIYMSATISDEAALVRELDCTPEAAENPIELPDAGGLGERMIIVPRLMTSDASSLTWENLSNICESVSKKYAVVVIAPSTKTAERWSSIGAHVVRDTSDVGPAIDGLRDGSLKFVVFINRYDGIDLPDDACRLLVLDGAPIAHSLLDAVDGSRAGAANVRQRTVAQRIEQGLGRAVRSPSDYSTVILWGDDLVSIISDKAMYVKMTEETRLQIDLGLNIAKAAKSEGNLWKSVDELIKQCLGRDSGWKKYYTQKVKVALKPTDSNARKRRILYAKIERKAWQSFISNRGEEGSTALQEYINDTKPEDEARAWILQRAAWYARGYDITKSLELQRAAHERNPLMLRPPKGIRYKKQQTKNLSAAFNMLAWYSRFEHGNAAIAAVDNLRSSLVFAPNASSEKFEEGLRLLGEILGLESSRPERDYNIGPDVLWLQGQTVVPIEAKNRTKTDSTAISKENAGQLTQSVTWAKETYAERGNVVPLIAHPSTQEGDAAFLPDGTRVFTPTMVNALLQALGDLVATLAGSPVEHWTAAKVEKLLGEHNLSLEQILSRFTAKVVA